MITDWNGTARLSIFTWHAVAAAVILFSNGLHTLTSGCFSPRDQDVVRFRGIRQARLGTLHTIAIRSFGGTIQPKQRGGPTRRSGESTSWRCVMNHETWPTVSPGLNRLADYQDMHQLARKAVMYRLLEMKAYVDATELPYSSHLQDYWLRLWEYSSVIMESRVDARMRVLDAGGTGTVFSYYLSAEGCDVHTVDLLEEKVRDARLMSSRLGLPMEHRVESIVSLSYPSGFFDRVFSISVIEHLPIEDQGQAVAELARVLKPGGILAVTFDYGPEGSDNPIRNADEVFERLVTPSGLLVLDNPIFITEVEDYCDKSPTWTFGRLFLVKPGHISLTPTRDCPLGSLPRIAK